jgi:peptide/nickel transport system substrate-binding protein
MEEAGYGGGSSLKFVTSPTYSIGNLVVQALQEQLGQIGIEVEIESLEWSLYLQKIQNKDWQDIRFGQWSCACLDADGVLYPLLHSSSGWSSYGNPDVDAALQTGKATIDPAERQRAYSQALRILRETTPILPLWQVEAAYAAKNTIKWQPTIDEQFYIMDMTFGDC